MNVSMGSVVPSMSDQVTTRMVQAVTLADGTTAYIQHSPGGKNDPLSLSFLIVT